MADAHAVDPFKLRDALTGRWYRARWKASLDEIERRSAIRKAELPRR